MIEQTEYVKTQLNKGIYNLSVVAKESFVSRPTLNKVKKGLPVSNTIIIALNDYFRRLGD